MNNDSKPTGEIEVNPQEVIILAEEMLRAGWVQGTEYREDGNAQGVCVAGALRDALTTVLRPQIELVFTTIPDVQSLSPTIRAQLLKQTTRQYADALHDIFRTRIQAVLGSGIETWNDASDRQKEEVLEAMRASLELITQECTAEWDKEALTERPTAPSAEELRPLAVANMGASKKSFRS